MSDVIKDRMNGIKEWLQEEHPEVFVDQKHTIANTVERAYWHYGYMMAINDLTSKGKYQ